MSALQTYLEAWRDVTHSATERTDPVLAVLARQAAQDTATELPRDEKIAKKTRRNRKWGQHR